MEEKLVDEKMAIYKMEKRKINTVKSPEVDEKDGTLTLRGFIPFNTESDSGLGFTEVITETAFNKTLSDNSPVFALYNHDSAKVLGSTLSNTLTLTKMDDGLVCEVLLPDTSYAKDLWGVIKRGDVQTMSFGFIPIKVDKEIKDGEERFLLREVKLMEISFGVPFPAYPSTSSIALLRSMEQLQKENAELRDRLLKLEGNKTSENSEAQKLLRTIELTIKL